MPTDDQTPGKNDDSVTISVVVATYNRTELLPILLRGLSEQSLPANQFELILIDDGSKLPARQALDEHALPYTVRLIEQENTGQAGARDRGVREAAGDIVVILDDDMVLDPDLLKNHLAWHHQGFRVVLGRIASAHNINHLPLFERFHAEQLDNFAARFKAGAKPRGVHLCTGNVSFRREDYMKIGGFDRNLKRSEDRDLGIRLELDGAPFVFGYDATTVHDSDHASLDVWRKRAFNYGVYDYQIYEKHHDVDIANPWRFFFHISPVSRPFMMLTVAVPGVGRRLASAAWEASEFFDKHGLKRTAIRGATYVYGLEYFRGLRQQAGSLTESIKGLRHCLKQRTIAPKSNLR
jgi:GT2 family glycosyltransferase